MSFTVLSPGQYSLLADRGRPAARSLGVPVGGAADRAALALGNALVGNPPDAAALEIAFAGPTLRAEWPALAVVFGAPFALTVSGRPVAAGTTFQLQPGDILAVGGTPAGARGYLCVAGGFSAPLVLGSRSGLEPVKAGDVFSCSPTENDIRRSLPFVSFDESYEPVLRAVDGPQRDWFPADGLFGQTYRVSPASNRMGIRFTGDPLTRRAGELASEAVAPGAAQVTNDGLPVVLGADGQTIGGYPKIAHVIRADLDRLAQLRPGDAVRFQRVTHAEAETAWRERAARLREWLVRLGL